MNLVINKQFSIILAEYLMSNDVYLAWGNFGILDTWSNEPPMISRELTELSNEVCRRKATTKQYLTLATEGTITMDGYSYNVSDQPTNTIMLTFNNAASDVPTEIIAQLGLFIKTIPDTSVSDKNYLLPDQITDKGVMIGAANISPIVRNSATAETRNIIINL